VSLGQLKVMSAIERCRTAALGGHVARCENDACGHTIVAYNRFYVARGGERIASIVGVLNQAMEHLMRKSKQRQTKLRQSKQRKPND
jgi:hypothetical protein